MNAPGRGPNCETAKSQQGLQGLFFQWHKQQNLHAAVATATQSVQSGIDVFTPLAHGPYCHGSGIFSRHRSCA